MSAKAVFLDYQGTILQMGGKDLEEMLSRVVRGCRDVKEEEILSWWFTRLHELESAAYLDRYVDQETLCLQLLQEAVMEFGLKENLQQLQQLNINYWMYAPLFTDVAGFLKSCARPVYILSNNAEKYINVCLRRHNLHVNGVITADQVRAYKPHRELYEQALKVSGCAPEDVVHIGDSLEEIQGAEELGIRGILLDRRKQSDHTDNHVVHSLNEALKLL